MVYLLLISVSPVKAGIWHILVIFSLLKIYLYGHYFVTTGHIGDHDTNKLKE